MRDSSKQAVPFIAAWVGLLITFSLFVATLYTTLEGRTLREDLDRLQQVYQHVQQDEAATLHGLLNVLARDPASIRAFLAGDRQALLRHNQDIFAEMKQYNGITHFAFTDLNRINLLRMHQPALHGDRIDRRTTLLAEQTDKMAYGIEIGSLGTMTLRVVLPWRYNGNKIGYLELGKEVNDLLKNFRNLLQFDVYTFLDKRLLNRELWESGMDLLGRSGEWNRYPHHVLAGGSRMEPQAVVQTSILERLQNTTEQQPSIIHHAHLLTAPLTDVSGQTVGILLGVVEERLLENLSEPHFLFISASFVLCVLVLFWSVKRGFDRYYTLKIAQEAAVTQVLRENAATLNLLFRLAGDLLCIVDHEGHFLHVSHSWERVLGYTPDELYQRIFLELLHPDDVAETQVIMRTLLNQDQPLIRQVNDRFRHKDGSWHWMEWSVAVHNKQTFYATGHDMTEQRQREEQLVRAKDLADLASHAKGAFLATMSHEIRTPMNAIIGLNTLALQHDLPPKVRDYLRKIRTASQSLLHIINDILDFSKMEAGKLEMEEVPFHLVEIFDNLGNLFRYGLENKKVELVLALSPDLLLELIGDPFRVEQVLVNLVSNALKFTQAGEVVVQAHCLKRTTYGVIVRFSVRDSGIGITPEQQKGLFQPFSQADNTITRRYGGTGLGLAISRQLVERMGGQLGVKSISGEGSLFYFTATFAIGSTPDYQPLLLDADLRGLPVLLVDDNDSAREALREMLQTFALTVTTVGSGPEALAALRLARHTDHPFALVLLDEQMPGMNGLATAAAIRQEADLFGTLPALVPSTTIPKLIWLRTGTDDGFQQAVTQPDLDGWIEKPCSRLLLFDTIRGVFGKPVATQFQNVHASNVEQQVRDTIAGARILLVDDIHLNRQVAQELLTGMGLAVEWAADGREAVQKVTQAERPFAAVLMDLEMPEMDGYEATRTIRQNPRHAQLPIIAMTAHAMDGVREQCLAAGMNGHMAKPIDPVELGKLLLRWIPAQERGG
ncbi:MAG: response regulator [Magnetococcales bacterium]|nr:response regulator [Magnetococcales bacterium]